MEKYIIILGIMFITVGITVNPAVAVETHRIYEMGESGQTVSFPMTAEEFAAEHSERERLSAIREIKAQKPKQRQRVFEMGESSQIVSFPMTAQEIADEDANIARPKALYDSKPSKVRGEVITFELAESGEIIEFPARGVEIKTEGVADTSDKIEADLETIPNS
jgi:hypothetical protein